MRPSENTLHKTMNSTGQCTAVAPRTDVNLGLFSTTNPLTAPIFFSISLTPPLNQKLNVRLVWPSDTSSNLLINGWTAELDKTVWPCKWPLNTVHHYIKPNTIFQHWQSTYLLGWQIDITNYDLALQCFSESWLLLTWQEARLSKYFHLSQAEDWVYASTVAVLSYLLLIVLNKARTFCPGERRRDVLRWLKKKIHISAWRGGTSLRVKSFKEEIAFIIFLITNFIKGPSDTEKGIIITATEDSCHFINETKW